MNPKLSDHNPRGRAPATVAVLALAAVTVVTLVWSYDALYDRISSLHLYSGWVARLYPLMLLAALIVFLAGAAIAVHVRLLGRRHNYHHHGHDADAAPPTRRNR